MPKSLKRWQIILVKRKNPNEVVYPRRYPRDYEEYHNRGKDIGAIHPNKLKTWLKFAEAARKARGKSFEEMIYTIKKEMGGKRFKERRKILVSPEEMEELKIQALMRGIEPRWVDILFTTEEKERITKNKKVKILSYPYKTY